MWKDHNRERKRSGCLQQIIVRKRHFPADEPSSKPFCRAFALPDARPFLQEVLSQKRLLSCESDSYRKTEALRLAKILSAGNPVRKNASLRASIILLSKCPLRFKLAQLQPAHALLVQLVVQLRQTLGQSGNLLHRNRAAAKSLLNLFLLFFERGNILLPNSMHYSSFRNYVNLL